MGAAASNRVTSYLLFIYDIEHFPEHRSEATALSVATEELVPRNLRVFHYSPPSSSSIDEDDCAAVVALKTAEGVVASDLSEGGGGSTPAAVGGGDVLQYLALADSIIRTASGKRSENNAISNLFIQVCYLLLLEFIFRDFFRIA